MRSASLGAILAVATIAGFAGAATAQEWIQTAADSRSGGSIAVTLLDPVPDLLSGSAVTTNYDTLATAGRPVQGVDADGVTELVLRWPAAAAGLQYAVTLFNDQGKQSISPNNDGALAPIGGTSFTKSKLAVISVNTSAGAMAFALYRAPIDFPRPGGKDSALSTRTVSIKVQQSTTSSVTTVSILRPPVLLVHGLWGAPSDWDSFTPFVTDARFEEFRADYSASISSELTSYTPSYPSGDQGTIQALATAASLGFSYNADSGQFILGEPLNQVNRRNRARLRSVAELYPSIVDPRLDDDGQPSCSAAESLERQESFVNQTLAQHALALLARLFRHGTISYHGGFVSLASGACAPMRIEPKTWKRIMRAKQSNGRAADASSLYPPVSRSQ